MSRQEQIMDIYADSIQHLSISDKLQLVERIWDDVALSTESIPIPTWAIDEARRRRDELKENPAIGLSHDEMWSRLNKLRHE
jgi:putative addiction module component (TIGR02574 family)